MADPVDLVVIASHPDDAEFSVGGTLLVAKKLGHRTAVIDLSRGELSSRGNLETRRGETERATQILGLDHRENLGLPDGDVRDTPEARERLADAIRRLRPKVVLAPWVNDLHPDHAGAGELVTRTWYLLGVGRFAEVEPPYRPHLLGYYMQHTPFEVSVILDVSSVWPRKVEAIEAYASQLHQAGVEGPRTKIAQPYFLQALEGRAREYGMQAGCEFGEPIRWAQPPLLSDPVYLRASWERA